jgi:predicted nucleotidyltransferase
MASRQPSDLERLLAALTAEFAQRQLPFMLIGGQAVLLHGSPRLTEDIDITLGADPAALPDLLHACAALGLKPLPLRVDEFVQETFVLPVRHEATRLRVDFIFSSTPYERQAIARAEQVSIGGASVPFASAEDLILHKLFAGRPRDLEDVRGVVRRKGRALDWSYVERWAAEFASIPGREQLPELVVEMRRLVR